MTNIDFSNCLRPETTERIVKELLKGGKSYNIFAPKGFAKTRFLEDIHELKIHNVCTVLLKIRSYRNNYEGYLKNFALKLGIGINGDLEKNINTCIEHSEKKVLILLDDFDSLFEPSIDNEYDNSFVNNLNYLKNTNTASIIYTSKSKISKRGLFFGGEFDSGSVLETEPEELPKLTIMRIETELLRRNENSINGYLKDTKGHINFYSREIFKHPHSYHFLNFIYNRIENEHDELKNFTIKEVEELLKKWRKEYNRQNVINIDKKLVELGKWTELLKLRTNKVLGIFIRIKHISNKWKIIFSIFLVIIFGAISFWNSILNLF